MTLVDGKAPTVLTAEGARRLTARIRDALSLADDLLAQALAGQAWSALGHDSFEAYCAAELPELRHIKLRAESRRARAKALLDVGATEREIAAATGASTGTAHNDVLALTGRAVLKNEQTEKVEPLPADIVEMCTAWQVVVRHVTRQGAKGLTCQEFELETGWNHGRSSAAFNAAERKGYVVRLDGVYRSAYGVYVATDR